MTYKDLVVHVDASPQGFGRLKLAANVAVTHQAHLTGLFHKQPPIPRAPLFVPEAADGGVDAAAKAARSCETAFRKELERAGIEGEWHVMEGPWLDAILSRAEYADLVIIGQAKPGTVEEAMDFPAEVALSCGRPVLVVPATGKFETTGERIMIAWKAGRESIRAIEDALPFLERARFVALFEVGDGSAGLDGLEGIAHHLARHDVKAERYVMTASDKDVGEALLSRAANFDCDLVVMGAYGHARLREIVFGGATRTVVRAMTIPILMSH